MTSGGLVSIKPQEVKFTFELKKQTSCLLQLSNKTNDYVAFRSQVLARHPEKYTVQPEMGIILPRSICDVKVTMQAQREAPLDMECKDKFVFQSVVAGSGTTLKDISTEMFKKKLGNRVEECSLAIVYVSSPQSPWSPQEGSEGVSTAGATVSDSEYMISVLPKKKKEYTMNVSGYFAAAKMTYGASSPSRLWKYDVFLSFCGQDTRTSFTDFLFNELVRDGIHTFRDNEELNRGEDINSELMKAIEGSRIAIIVFSKNYASSTWCLSELVKILGCKKDGRTQKVMPIFYKVDTSDVRHQLNTYAEAFKGHEERFKEEKGKVKMWRAALTEAANMAGWDQRNVADGHEAELTKKIVEEVLIIVNQTRLHVATHPIGLDSHIEHIVSLLNDGVHRIIGIYGPGGIGKTTIAKAVLNVMFKDFEGSSFLSNIREVSSQQKGLAILQKQLLSDVLKRKDIDISNEDQGIIIIKERLRCKRVLIVLDDVNELKQFDKLIGVQLSFDLGSRIILTTRDEHLLNGLNEVEKYIVNTMNPNDSLQLFSYHAFRQRHPLEDYVQLSNDVLDYAGGLPLALVILGSLLYNRSQVEWEWELKKLRKIPNSQILEKLEISYNALDGFDQIIFLDISCFFVGREKGSVINILDARGLGGEAGIKMLTERSLVTTDDKNNLCMHDLIRDMGREIIRKQSPQKPGGYSRLWSNDDAIDVLTNLTGTEAVEGFQLLVGDDIKLNTKGFSKMPNLRLLEIHIPKSSINIDREHPLLEWVSCFRNLVCFSCKEFPFEEHSLQQPVSCFRNLVWFSWKEFPFECMPNNFHLGNLIRLEMQLSNLKRVWKETKYLTKLKHLDLSDSPYLTCMPDFSGLPDLEKLILSGCECLVEVHKSINHLKKLVYLDLRNCSSLRNLPSGISFCSKLETLDVSVCKRLESIPMLPSSLCYLNASRCWELKWLPNLSNLNHLLMLDLSYCKNLTEIEGLEGLKSAEEIKFGECVNLKNSIKERIFQDISNDFGNHNVCNIILDGDEIPEWFGFQTESLDPLSCQVITRLENMDMQPQGLIVCFVCSCLWTMNTGVEIIVYNVSKNFTWRHNIRISVDSQKETTTWVMKIPNCVLKSISADDGDDICVSVSDGGSRSRYWRVEKIGLHFFDTMSQHENAHFLDSFFW